VSRQSTFSRDVCVVGGGGHVGLPLALTFADSGLKTVIYDINRKVVDAIRDGKMPFTEEGAQEILDRVLANGSLSAYTTPEALPECKFVVLIIGTPVDEHLNPQFSAIHKAIDECDKFLRDGQILILRSTVFPGISRLIQNYVDGKGLKIKVAFCPERVAQGHSIREFHELPQIISAFDPSTLAQVRELFSGFTPEFVEMEPMEAELCKLMTNAWRYIQCATVNQFYMIASEHGLDFNRILHGCRFKYPRMIGMPGPGLTAGPCLVKDTMQLAAFSHNKFVIGHAAMLINEGLPSHMISLAKRKMDLTDKTVGILGMAFKAESDDSRDSLSFKLRKLLTLECKRVICSDPYVKNAKFVPQEQVLAEADLILIGVPHKPYKKLSIPESKLIDVWNCIGKGPTPDAAAKGDAKSPPRSDRTPAQSVHAG
jgi:UDP-N-acetyl-D-mannosaminuronic acid dehydrogenase